MGGIGCSFCCKALCALPLGLTQAVVVRQQSLRQHSLSGFGHLLCHKGHCSSTPAAQGDLYPCHQFVGDPKYLMGDIWKGVTNTAVRDEFKHCNAYARKECQNCWAKLYCSGGCAANSYHATGNITGVYEYGCELFKKRMECAIMIKVAENQELAAKGIEVPIELGSTCNACADGEACE